MFFTKTFTLTLPVVTFNYYIMNILQIRYETLLHKWFCRTAHFILKPHNLCCTETIAQGLAGDTFRANVKRIVA